MQLSAGVSRSILSCLTSNELIRTQQVPEWQFELQCFRIQDSFAPVHMLFSPFDGSKILLLSAQKTFGFYKLISRSEVRDCSLFIVSTGLVFRDMGQGLFLMLPSTGHKDFLCFYGTGHELFLEIVSQIIFV